MKTSLIAALVTALIVAGCASPPPPTTKGKVDVAVQKEAPFQIIQHQLTVVGGDIPQWVTMDSDELETVPQYKDKYVFKFDGGEAKDLDGAKIVTKKIDAADQITTMVNQRVQAKFSGAQVGDKTKVETYFENVVKSLGDAKITGFRQEKEFWVQIQYKKPDGSLDPDRIFYRYFVLFSVPKDMLNNQIKKAFDNQDAADKPKTEDEQTARDRVKQAFSEGF